MKMRVTAPVGRPFKLDTAVLQEFAKAAEEAINAERERMRPRQVYHEPCNGKSPDYVVLEGKPATVKPLEKRAPVSGFDKVKVTKAKAWRYKAGAEGR